MFEKFRNKIALGFDWVANKLHIDEKKLDLIDVKELYEMVNIFISGGDDRMITAEDAVILLTTLNKLIAKNKITESNA